MDDTAKRLSEEEKAFAEKNIGLLFAFMHRYHLPEDYFGALALAYVRFVSKYLKSKEAYSYSFSTLVWHRLRSEFSHIVRKENKNQQEKQIENATEIQGQEDSYFEEEIIGEMSQTLTQKQVEVLLLRMTGFTNAQIATEKGVSEHAVEKLFSRIRKTLKKYTKYNDV